MKDYSEYKELYLKCFTEDTAEDAEYLFKTVLSKAFVIEKRDAGKLISMLFLMESSLITKDQTIPVFYLYAAATLPERRGEGIMGELLKKAKDFAIQKGKKAIFLKPANSSLFAFYKKYGFYEFFKINCSNLNKADLLPYKMNITAKSITLSDWQTKRRVLLKGFSDCFADFSDNLFAAATTGLNCLSFNDFAFAVYERSDNKIVIKEGMFVKNNANYLLALAYFLLEKYNVDNIEIRTPAFCDTSHLFEERFFSVIWYCEDIKKTIKKSANAYHGFAFD